MEKVKQFLTAGVSLPSAIKEALGMSLTAFADKHSLSRQITSQVINLDLSPREPYCSALAAELGGSAFEWAELLWTHARPQADRYAAAVPVDEPVPVIKHFQ